MACGSPPRSTGWATPRSRSAWSRLLTGIVYSLLPYGGHPTGLDQPMGARWRFRRHRHPRPVRLHRDPGCRSRCSACSLFRIRAFTAGNVAGLLAPSGGAGCSSCSIIWLQGIWLPQHGYSFSQTPLWAGHLHDPADARLPLVGPLSGILSDRFGARGLATVGLGACRGFAFLLLELLPMNFTYIWFRPAASSLFAVGMGLFFSPNQAASDEQPPARPAWRRGRHDSSRSKTRPRCCRWACSSRSSPWAWPPTSRRHLFHGLTAAGVAAAAARLVANEPPIGSLFSAFLGYNPVKELLGPTGALQHLSASQAAYVTGRSFFPKLIEQPFSHGLHLAFDFAAGATVIAVIASALRGKRYIHKVQPVAEELAEGAAESAAVAGLPEDPEAAENGHAQQGSSFPVVTR